MSAAQVVFMYTYFRRNNASVDLVQFTHQARMLLPIDGTLQIMSLRVCLDYARDVMTSISRFVVSQKPRVTRRYTGTHL